MDWMRHRFGVRKTRRLRLSLPDGQWIGFVESTISPTFARIKKVSILGGPAIVVAQLPDLPIAGATWLTDGTIVVGTTRGLKKIAPTGAVTDVTTSDPSAGERAHAWPSAVSGSTMVLFAITPVGAARPKIAVVDVSNGRMVRLPIEGTGPRYASTGHIVYAASDGSLSAAPFDLKHLAVAVHRRSCWSASASSPRVPQTSTCRPMGS